MTDITDKEKREIEMCLNCPLPECINCLEEHVRINPQRYIRQLHEVKRMSELGYNDTQMSTALGVNRNTVYQMRKVLGIPGLHKRIGVEYRCDYCGKPVMASPSRYQRAEKHFCSVLCSNRFRLTLKGGVH